MNSISQRETAKPNMGNHRQETLEEYFQNWLTRVRAGRLGSLPLLAGLLIIAIIFGIREPMFFGPRNFVNLLLQMAGITTIAIGVVFVLLIAEIDLSVGYVSGVGSVVMVLLLREEASNWSWPLAMGAALLTTTMIGLFQGYLITKFGIPSFVVTLAGLLAWSGIVLIMTTQYSNIGTISMQDDVILGIANSYLTPT
ncbi:MAG: ABC transporter permease, partial [Chloroflexi bacterium]